MNILKLLRGDRARRDYRDHGYHVFRGALPRELVDAVADTVCQKVRPYQGPILRQDGQLAAHDFFPGTSVIRNSLLDAHLPISGPMKPIETTLTALITSTALGGCLREIDGAEHYNIHQTLLFFAAQTTEIHLDSWALDTAPRGFAHTLWIPLQDMDFRSGMPSVIAWPIGKVISEADLGLPASGSEAERYHRYQAALSARLLADSPEVSTSLVRKGDFIVWTSLTPHCTLPAQPFPAERLSLQVLLRPLHHRWGNFIDQPSDHPTNRHIRMTEQFSYFVNEQISRDYQIAGSLPAPAA